MPNYYYDHVHLTSPDPLKTAEFYERMFGARRVDIREIIGGRTLVNLTLNESAIKVSEPRAQSLVPGASQPLSGLEHFGLRTDNLEAAVDELKAKGVKFLQDIRVSNPGLKVSFFLAPEDVAIELVERSS